MSYISDYKVGAISYEEYVEYGKQENNRERMDAYLDWCDRYYPDGDPNEEDEEC